MEQIREALRKIANDGRPKWHLLTGKVLAVEDDVCDVAPSDGGPELYKVRLRPLLDGKEVGVLITPTIGSDVLVGHLDSQEACVVAYSQVDRVRVKIATTDFEIDKDGFGITRGGESLKKLLNDLIQAISTITVPTAVGPSGPPINVSILQSIKARISTLLS